MTRKREPPEKPTLYEQLPMWCVTCDDEKLETEEEALEHKGHLLESSPPKSHERQGFCSVCRPRPDEHKKRDSIFCDEHKPEDLRQMMIESEERMMEERMEREMSDHE